MTITSNAAWTFGTGDFTIEMWVYFTASASPRVITNRGTGALAGSFSFNLGTDSAAFTEVITGEPAVNFTYASSILNTWAHVAVVRISGVTYCYVNGVSA
jgi:hypothetical protein